MAKMRKVLGRFEMPPFDWHGRVEGKRIVWEDEGEVMWLEPYGKNRLRFRSSKNVHINEELNWNLLPTEEPDNATVEVFEDKAVIRNGRAVAEVLGNGTVNYYNSEGKVILREYWIDEREITVALRCGREYKTVSSEVFEMDLYFKPDPTEHFYGMGQDPNDCFDLKGCTIPLEQKNTKCTIPFVYSTKQYGFLWNNPAIGEAQFVNNHTKWHVEAAKQIDYILIVEDTPAEIMRSFTEITGRSIKLPEWASGFWQSKLRYRNQEELLSVAREYKRRGIPISVIVIDYFHWTQQGEWKFDPKDWPDPAAMVKELDEMGVRLMVSIWPTVDTRSENFNEMRRGNMLIRSEAGQAVMRITYGSIFFFDATSEKAREFVWSKVKKNYFDYGIKCFWLDETEPSYAPYHYRNIRLSAGNGLEVSSVFPYYYAKAFHDGLAREGEKDAVLLTRCGWLGSQRNNVVVWSGDIASTWDSLRIQIKCGLNFSFSGIPWWTTDIGGFFNGNPQSEEFRELAIRWFQFGVFCPIFRIHGYRLPMFPTDRSDPLQTMSSGGPNEVWSYGDTAYEVMTDLIFMRQRLKPYIMKHMQKAADTGCPVMRPLLFDFYDDENTYNVFDEMMFGDDILVAPVTEYKARSRRVYLPKGAVWKEGHTGKVYEGGKSYECEAPIEFCPVFLRDDAELPLVK